MNYICPSGHKHSITWHNWKAGYRCLACHTLKLNGPGNPNWQGGKSFITYCQVWRDREFKNDIKERDDYKCLNPYCDSKDPSDLTIHHIDYDKKNCSPKNLITVCRSCNVRANFDKLWHKAWYKAIIKNRHMENKK